VPHNIAVQSNGSLSIRSRGRLRRSMIEGLPGLVTSDSSVVLGVDQPQAKRRGVGIGTLGILVVCGSPSQSCSSFVTLPSPLSRGPW